MLLTFMIIISISFVLIKLVPITDGTNVIINELEKAKREALGYNKPIIVQFKKFIFPYGLRCFLEIGEND